jgi:hypothetical protein
VTEHADFEFGDRALPKGGVHLGKAELPGRIPLAVGQEVLRVVEAGSSGLASLIEQLHDVREGIDSAAVPDSVLGYVLQTEGLSISDLRTSSLPERQINEEVSALRNLGLIDIVETPTDQLLFLATPGQEHRLSNR